MAGYRKPDSYYPFTGMFLRDTEKAVQLKYDDFEGETRREWFPKSQFNSESQDIINGMTQFEESELRIKEFIARDKGIIE